MNRPALLTVTWVIVACHAIICAAGVGVDTSPPTHSHSPTTTEPTPQNQTTLNNDTSDENYNSSLNDSPWNTEGDDEADPLPATLIYEIYPSAKLNYLT